MAEVEVTIKLRLQREDSAEAMVAAQLLLDEIYQDVVKRHLTQGDVELVDRFPQITLDGEEIS